MKESGICEACCQDRDGDEGIDIQTRLCAHCEEIIHINDDPDQLIGIGRYLQNSYKNAIDRSKVRFDREAL